MNHVTPTSRLLRHIRAHGLTTKWSTIIRVAVEVLTIVLGTGFPRGYRATELSVTLMGEFLRAHRDRVAQSAVDQIGLVGGEMHDA